jgi:DNA-binding protein YbaB
MAETFKTNIQQAEGLNATGIRVPAEVIEAFGSGKKPKVKVTVNGYTYRSTVAAFGDVFMLPLSQEHRQAAGVKAGDDVEVTLELDTEPRTVEVPEELKSALMAKPGAWEAFEGLAFSRRKEAVRQVNEAKAEETRKRRIEKIVGDMG